MAVDTEPKRWGMMSFGGGELTHVLVNPTGSDMNLEAERVALLGCYGGINIDAPGGAAVVPIFLLNAQRPYGGMI